MPSLSPLLSLPSVLAGAPRTVAGITGSLQVLPAVLAELERIGASVRSMPAVEASLAQMAQDTRVLAGVQRDIARVGASVEVMPEMQRQVGEIAGTVPALVDVQQALPALLPLLRDLSSVVGHLQESLTQLEVTVHTLADVAEPLQGTAERLGRLFGGRRARAEGIAAGG